MPLPMTLEQAEKARQSGLIKPETFNMMYPPEGGASEPAPPMAPVEPAAAAPVEPSPEPEDTFSQIASQTKRDLDAKAAARKAEEEAESAALEDNQIRLLSDQIAYNVRLNNGDMEKARKASAAQVKQLEELQARRAQRQPAMQPASMQTADMPQGGGAAPANVVLASDRQPRADGQTIGGSAGDTLKAMLSPSLAGYNLEAQGIRESAAAGQAKAAEESAYLERLAKEDADRVETMKVAEQERQAKLDASFAKMDEAANDIATQKVDPNRLWASKTTGDKVMAGVALFLGAFGAIDGGPNRAVTVINDAIKRDIEAQKANIDLKKDVYAARSGIYGKMLETFKDRRAAEEATRVAYIENTQLKIKAMAAKYSGQEVAAKAKMLLGELETKKIEARQKFAASILSAMPPTDPMQMNQEQRERWVPELRQMALTKEDATDLKKTAAEAATTKDGIQKLLKISEIPGKSLSPEMRAEATTLAATIRGTLRVFLVGPGAVTESEQKLLDTIIANPTHIASLDSSSRTTLKTLASRVDAALANKVKSYGLTTTEKRIGFETAGK